MQLFPSQIFFPRTTDSGRSPALVWAGMRWNVSTVSQMKTALKSNVPDKKNARAADFDSMVTSSP
jgi:hypothetical protein